MARKTSFQWLCEHVDYDGDECLIWPFFRDPNGYGRLGRNRKQLWAHREMCILANGPAPSDIHESSHSCGRGCDGCVHPKHLSWKTPSENQLERRKHGTHGRGGRMRLTEEKVSQILARRGIETQYALAAKFGVSHQAISMIHNGKIWKDGRSRYVSGRPPNDRFMRRY
jgi:hypothetical protein